MIEGIVLGTIVVLAIGAICMMMYFTIVDYRIRADLKRRIAAGDKEAAQQLAIIVRADYG